MDHEEWLADRRHRQREKMEMSSNEHTCLRLWLEGYQQRQISQLTGLTVVTIGQYVAKARRKLFPKSEKV